MLQNIVSILFYLTFILYIFQGLYCLTLNREARLNQVFFFMCLSFSIWAFGLALSNSLNNYEDVLMWRRFASFGWGVAFSLILHFTLILTKEDQVLRSKWIYFALYLPAAVTVLVFGLYGNLANQQYNLIHSAAGWGNISVNNFWGMVFNSYYISFSLLTLFLIFKWYKTADERDQKKQALWLFWGFAVALIFGTLSEKLANSYLSIKIPSLAPMIILIPVLTFAYNIKKYGLMTAEASKKIWSSTEILSDYSHRTFIRYCAIVYFIMSIVILCQCFFYTTELWTDMLLSTIYVLMGLIVYSLPYMSLSVPHQDWVLTLVLVVTIPISLSSFTGTQMTNILWPMPLIFFIMTIIFNRPKMFVVIAVVTTLTGIFVYISEPEQTIHVGALDYMARLCIYTMAIMLAAYINKVYIVRIKENDQQIGFQKMLSSISTSFVAVTSANFDEKVTDMLRMSSTQTNADQGFVFMFSDDKKSIGLTHQWLGEGAEPIVGNPGKFQSSSLTWLMNQLLNNCIVYIKSPECLGPEALMERDLLITRNVQSLICIPIRSKDSIIGCIGFDQVISSKNWQVDDHELLKVLSNILAEAIAKVETEKEINYLAYYDALTGLPNRVLFTNRLEQAVELAKLTGKFLGVIFIDIDGLKEVNDTLGHDWGDYLLNDIGKRLLGCIRKDDTAARFGGDEFLIMVPQLSSRADLKNIVKKIMGVFQEPAIVEDQEFYVTASGGIAIYPEDGENVNVLIKNADLAMYAAKKNGKGQVAFCSTEMKDEVLKKMTLSNCLHRALERNELHLKYQPQVCLKTQSIIGFEALLRWNHPDLGPISPVEFIPIAEQTGLINTIGEWVLLNACAQNKAWQDRGLKPVQMAVNLSVEQFRNGNVLEMVKGCLEKTGMEPRYLELEITEGIAMKESGYIVESLHALKKLGVSISIDDFGTEYSSLSRLKDLPVDRLKIDMQFIQRIGVSRKDESIIAVMIHLAKRLRLKIIAEGVETEAQLKFLKDEGCDEIQGYYYYKPLPGDEIEANSEQMRLLETDAISPFMIP
ncbi:EAL domain-containing protein [Acetobacterium bakii]|nr:EAL domain-containing protein [Acetobacterium bakii]